MSALNDLNDLPPTAGAVVDEFLRLIMIPDPDAARRYTAPGLRILFTGGRAMRDPADCTAFNKARYKWVKKRIERTETVALSTAAGTKLDDEAVVYSLGTLYGQWLDGTPFEGNRYVDRYVVKGGLITQMDVWNDSAERQLLLHCRQQMRSRSGQQPQGWLSPWISESHLTPDLLAETGYSYTLNWCHDDQPLPMRTRSGQALWAVPYPQELNDIPMIIARQMDGKDFAQMIIDQLDEMLDQTRGPNSPALVMGIALHPYIVGQPYRLRHLRRALQHVAAARDAGRVWMTTPGAIARHAVQVAG